MSSGSKSEFAVFAHSAMPRLRQIAFAWCRDWWQADDAVQATLERVMRRWPTLKDQEAAFAYTRTALVNHMVSESRRAWRQREIPHGDNLPDRAAPPSTQFEQDGLLSLVGAFLRVCRRPVGPWLRFPSAADGAVSRNRRQPRVGRVDDGR